MGLLFIFNALKIQISLLTPSSFYPLSYVELTFVKSANAIIKRQEEQVELRRTMAKKKREKDPKLPKEPKPNTPKPDDKPDIKHPEEGPKKPDPKKPEEGGGKKPEGGGTGGDPDIRLPEE